MTEGKGTTHSVSRRHFLKGALAASGGVALAGAAGFPAASGKLPLALATRRAEKLDDLYEISPSLQRFNQKNEMFCRFVWDEQFNSKYHPLAGLYPLKGYKNEPGWGILDWAFGQALWAVTNYKENVYGWRTGNRGFVDWKSLGIVKVPPQRWQASPEDAAVAIKKVARTIAGVADVGLTSLDPRWIYTDWYDRGTKTFGSITISDQYSVPTELEDGSRFIPTTMKTCIVMVHEMPYEATATGNTPLSHAATGQGYSLMAYAALTMGEFIRGLGYNAIPCCNDTAMSIPMAAAAGLGEVGRNGMLIHPVLGPRLRISKVYTDLPVAFDKPADYGVRRFCRNCAKCQKSCPSGAVAAEETNVAPNMSSVSGVKKWYVNAEKCRVWWAESGSSCMTCIAVCPYNKPREQWTHEMGRVLAPYLGKVMVTMDDWMGYGLKKPEEFWSRD